MQLRAAGRIEAPGGPPDGTDGWEPREGTRLTVSRAWGGSAGPRLRWAAALGVHVLGGEAPHLAAQASSSPWQPDAAGLCTHGGDPSCRRGRVFPEVWAAVGWRPAGGRAEVEGWLGWWQLGGPFSPLGREDLLELVFGSQAPPVGGAGVRLRAGPDFTYEKWAAALEGGQARYLLGHRARWHVGGGLEAQVSELAVVAPEFAARHEVWLPFWPLYLAQHAALAAGHQLNNAANVYMAVSARWSAGPRGPALGGELLVDDMPQRPGDPVLHQIGFGVWLEGPAGGGDGGGHLRLDYRRVHRFVYTFQNPALSYVHGGQLLGYPDGSDADSLRVAWVRDPPRRADGPGRAGGSPPLRLRGVGLEWRRRGPGRLGEIWESGDDREGARERQFLAGPVEHTLLVTVRWELARDGELTVSLGPVWDVNGQRGRQAWLVGVGWSWSGP